MQHWATERVILDGEMGLFPYSFVVFNSFFLGFAHHVLYALVQLPGLWDRRMHRIECSLSVDPGNGPIPLRGSWDPVRSGACPHRGQAPGGAGPAVYPYNALQFFACM